MSERSAPIRFARSACLALALWPFVHFGLVQAFELHPWRFGGFAMYAAPRPALRAREIMLGPDREHLRPIPLEQLPSEVRARVLSVLGEGLEARASWGKLYDPTPQAAALFELSPSARVLVMSLDACTLDARAFTACSTERYDCGRTSDSIDCRARR
jgi:hypothetical protein